MGRAPCCDKANVKKGPWSPEEDAKLKEFIEKFGTGGNWIALPQKAGLKRCGKSCRLRWLNYLRPNIKHGEFSDDEDRIICSLYASIGSRWSIIAAQLPGRTDNDIKNYWNTKLKKKLMSMMIINNTTNSINNPLLDQRKLLPPPPPPPPLFSSPPPPPPPPSQSFLSFSTPFYNYTPNSSTKSSSFSSEPLESVPLHQNLLYNNSNTIIPPPPLYDHHHVQESSLVMNPNHNPNPNQFYPGKDNMLVFGGGGGTEASCSSSDGSCSQISYGKEINGYNNMLDHNNYQVNVNAWNNNDNNEHDGDEDDDLKHNVFSNDNNQLEYDLEEVKQLISSGNNNRSFNEKGGGIGINGMYCYYY